MDIGGIARTCGWRNRGSTPLASTSLIFKEVDDGKRGSKNGFENMSAKIQRCLKSFDGSILKVKFSGFIEVYFEVGAENVE
jgi:hypothetical protein